VNEYNVYLLLSGVIIIIIIIIIIIKGKEKVTRIYTVPLS